MSSLASFLVFRLESAVYGLPLESVVKVYQMVEVSPLPQPSQLVMGVVNIRGKILPVLDIRQILVCLPSTPDLTQVLILVQTAKRQLCLWGDGVEGVQQFPADEVAPPDEILDRMEFLLGVIRLPEGMMFIPNLAAILDSATWADPAEEAAGT